MCASYLVTRGHILYLLQMMLNQKVAAYVAKEREHNQGNEEETKAFQRNGLMKNDQNDYQVGALYNNLHICQT